MRNLILFGTLLVLPSFLYSQDPRGTLLGRIHDATGAVIPSAAIKATNLQTGVVAVAQSNESGRYNMPYLIPGAYTVIVELTGFKRFVREGVQVRVGEPTELEIELSVGEVTSRIVRHPEVDRIIKIELEIDRTPAAGHCHAPGILVEVHLGESEAEPAVVRRVRPQQSGDRGWRDVDCVPVYAENRSLGGERAKGQSSRGAPRGFGGTSVRASIANTACCAGSPRNEGRRVRGKPMSCSDARRQR